MNKIRSQKFSIKISKTLFFFISILFTFFLWLIISCNTKSKGYSLFIEFNNAHGIKMGTSLRMRGVNIGYIKGVKTGLNSILVLVYITSTNILIPKNSIIETNQTGLLNDTVIDILPLERIDNRNVDRIDLFSRDCIKSRFVCHLSCLEGDRGLNYDDLVRAATRISQRFDDPSFFNIFYLFLQNSVELSDDILSMTVDVSNLLTLLYKSLYNFLNLH